jgi:hypothetical protein
MITSGEGGSSAAKWGHRSGGVGALIDLIHQRPTPHTFDHNLGSVKAPSLTPDNDDDLGGLGFWKWRSMVTQIVAWGAAITLLALTGIMSGMLA